MQRDARVLTVATMNQAVVHAEYAVRGELAIRSELLRRQLSERPGSLPFERVVQCNIGNPQQLGQRPLTFLRQVLALVEYPALIEAAKRGGCAALFPPDTVSRAEELVAGFDGVYGAYTHSQGALHVRRAVASFIARRDETPNAHPSTDALFLTNGASEAVRMFLHCVVANPSVGVMVPVPVYPLYSAAVAMLRGRTVPYALCENNGWSLDTSELERAHSQAVAAGTDVRALVLINPGNPTGSCLPRKTLDAVIAFCRRRRVVLLADEVYQANVYGERMFCSARRAYHDALVSERGAATAARILCGEDDNPTPPNSAAPTLELASFHSTSKGLLGECGHRGGYMELVGIDPDVCAQMYKEASVSLCPNVAGQALVGLMVAPPAPGDASYDAYTAETAHIHASLERRGTMLRDALAALPGISCQPAAGALYLFPRIHLPHSYVAHARREGRAPDAQYALHLLEATGICVVPGSGFGQEEGTLHVRTTFLPPEDTFADFIAKWSSFHCSLMDKWSSC